MKTRKLSYKIDGKIHDIPISQTELENLTFSDFLKKHYCDLKGWYICSCDRMYESGSAYAFPQHDWGKSVMARSTCTEYRIALAQIQQTQQPNTIITKEITTMTQFTGVKEQVKHEIFGLDIATATKDQLIELAEFINKKIAAAKGLNLTTSLYVRNEISSLTALLDKTIAKLDEGVEV